MPPSFWTNTIWYILLGFSSVITIIFVLLRSQNRKFTIAFTLAALGFTLLIETVIALFFTAYLYYPKIVSDQFQDAVLGNLFSQVSIAATSALTIVYSLSYGWYIAFAAIYFFIDMLFVQLGIYQHFWYKSIYTFIGFLPLFWVIKAWYVKLISSPKYITFYITLFLGVFSSALETIILPLKLSKTQIFQIHFYNDMSKSHTTTAILYLFLLISILIILYKWKLHPAWKGTFFAILFLIQYALYCYGIIYFKDGWFLIGSLIDLLGVYLWIVILDHCLRRKPAVIT